MKEFRKIIVEYCRLELQDCGYGPILGNDFVPIDFVLLCPGHQKPQQAAWFRHRLVEQLASFTNKGSE